MFAATIGSTKVEDLLKETSSVPTLVSADQLGNAADQYYFSRMLSWSVSEMILISTRCS
jgi:hypothetical protein